MASRDQHQQQLPGHYSGHNKIPDIKTFVQNLDREKRDRDQTLDQQRKEERQRNPRGGSEVEPHHQIKAGKPGTTKTVTDPTTGNQVQIEDVDKDFMKAAENPMLSVPNANLGKDTTVKTDPSQFNPDYKHNQDVTAPPDPVAEGSTSDVPIHGEKTNILFHPTPSVNYEPMFNSLEKRAGGLCIGVFLAVVILGKMFGGSLKGLIPTAACIVSGIWLWMKEVVRSGRELEWSSEQERGETATANLLPESVEWMNTLLSVVWGLINPDMFASVADTLEDVMSASVPGIIENVRVADINQGSNPIRILSLRALPDTHVKELKESIHEDNKKTKDPQEAAAAEEGGDYYNLEASFAYHAKPSDNKNDTSARARNMHMQLVFYLGIKGLFGVPLPIFVELQGLVGTVRLRLMMTPDPPFLKTLTFTLMGLPQVQAGCIPMVEKGVNILNLPLISNFVNYAIGAAASMYVAPKSMSLDMGAMLTGDTVQKDVIAMGVLWIRIHRAKDLSKQDRRGSKGGGSDPYVTLSFSKYGKPMYCTRVITDDLNPIWEETAALLVTPELIKADEQLSVELWDSDRSSADDIVGKIELSMQKMIQHPGKMYPQVSKLRGMEADSEMPGELHWEVGYFGKPHFRPALRTDGKNPTLPKELKDKPELQDEKGNLDTEYADAVAHTPPDPLWPSGICSVIIHQIVNLELENIQGSDGNRKGREYEPAREAGENTEEESKKLPSSYCTIFYNDQLVYRTRTKVVSSKPIFNAGTERFVRDWRSAIVTVAVRDSRHREHDPLLGIVPLRLPDILQTSSQVTRWYPFDGGIGFGRVRISLLFRSIETRLPPNMLGWDVGTFEFLSSRILALNYHHHAKLKMRTGGSSGAIGKTQCRALAEGDGVYWDIAKNDGKNNVRLPVKFRYRSPVVFEFHTAGKRSATAYAMIWLHHLVDNTETNINIPIWTAKNGPRLIQNYVTEDNVKAKAVPGLEDIEEIGRLQFRCQFKAGTDESHQQYVVDDDSRETFETWEACVAEGVRERKVTKELPPAVEELHERSLTEGRDVLKNADPEERQKWLAKDGQDWSGAFSHDPKAYMDSSGKKRREPGAEAPLHDPYDPSSDDDDASDGANSTSSDGPDLGMQDGGTALAGQDMGGARERQQVNGDAPSEKGREQANKRTEKRKNRGLRQWKPIRNMVFAKDEAKFKIKQLQNKATGGLGGREPGVETEVVGVLHKFMVESGQIALCGGAHGWIPAARSRATYPTLRAAPHPASWNDGRGRAGSDPHSSCCWRLDFSIPPQLIAPVPKLPLGPGRQSCFTSSCFALHPRWNRPFPSTPVPCSVIVTNLPPAAIMSEGDVQPPQMVVAEAHNIDTYHVPKAMFEKHPAKPHIDSLETYQKLYKESIEDGDKFWGKMARELLTWERDFQTVSSGSFENGDVAWFLEGKLNASYNCIDRHAFKNPNKPAIIYEADDPKEGRTISYGELLRQVSKLSFVLKQMGVKRGDTVALYLPMVPEALIAFLACSRIGAVHSVVFAGFSSDSLRDRVIDAQSKVVITSDEGKRGGKVIGTKKIVDDALKQCPDVSHCLVFKRTGADVPWTKGRDWWWHEELEKYPNYIPPEPMNSEDPLFLLYTSGSTGKPKGVMHTTAGYLLGAAATGKYVFDIHDNDKFFCGGDVGWITGHTYVVYAPLLLGCTTVVFEGTPAYPDFSRYWEVIDKHEVSQFYVAPTALRLLKRAGDSYCKHPMKKLRILGSVGEPIAAEVWKWYFDIVGKGEAHIVDTYWQTETGSHVITPLGGVTPTKPGSASLPFFGIEPAIIDPVSGEEIHGNDVEGVLAIKKPWPSMARTVWGAHKRYMDTYFNVYKGYYFTGDGAGRDHEGYYWIRGRVDDVVNVSGHRLSTAEIEAALLEHHQVAEAAVVGINDELSGQAVNAFVALKEGNETSDQVKKDLVLQVRKSIGPFAAPKAVFVIDDLPKTRSGKIMRRILRKILSGEEDSLGDTSTLSDPSVVDKIIEIVQASRKK